jgi:hypothetical protein
MKITAAIAITARGTQIPMATFAPVAMLALELEEAPASLVSAVIEVESAIEEAVVDVSLLIVEVFVVMDAVVDAEELLSACEADVDVATVLVLDELLSLARATC